MGTLSEDIGKLYCVLLGLGMTGHVKIAVGLSTMSACCCKLFLRNMAEYVCVWESVVSVASSCVVDYIRGRRRLGGAFILHSGSVMEVLIMRGGPSKYKVRSDCTSMAGICTYGPQKASDCTAGPRGNNRAVSCD